MRNLVLKSSIVLLLYLIALAGPAFSQCVPLSDATLPTTPLTYPMTSDRYAVQYQVGGGGWTNARVYISYYGETDGSPYRTNSGYSLGSTSMSFVSIPARPNTVVQLRVTKLFDTPFQPSDHVSVRPSVKLMDVQTLSDGTVQIATMTGAKFAGEQFILWWNRGADGGGVESLAFFLNPPYTEPDASHNKVKLVTTSDDLDGDLSAYDTLDFEGTVAIGSTGAAAYLVPHNILKIFLGPDAWVQGKLRFDLTDTDSTGAHQTRLIYGPGVLDVSRFNYELRACDGTADEYYALSSHTTVDLNRYQIDGIVIIDHDHAANDIFFNSTINNMKTLGWNSENAALRLGDNTTVSNSFVRSGDDSLMIWGSPVSVTNTTIWQNFNGGVMNLGWAENSKGDHNLVNGLYIVKTDWLTPTAITPASWTARDPADHPLQGQNNAIFASLMVPTTMYGTIAAPLFRNIFLDDPPQVLFSLKIVPPICAPTGLVCPTVDLTQGSVLNLNIENLFTPASILQNSIGFQNIPNNYTGDGLTGYTLTGTMKIDMTNVFVKPANGNWKLLTSADAASVGQICTNGSNAATIGQNCGNASNVTIKYNFDPVALLQGLLASR